DEKEARRPQRDLVAVDEDLLVHALAADVGAVQRSQVAEEELVLRRTLDLRMLLGDDAVEDLDGVVGVAPDGVEGGELELLPIVAGDEDELGHARPTSAPRRRDPSSSPSA